MLGILLVDKPQGITSHDVIAQVRRRFGLKRVGHAGTLDPLATGLLVVAVGPATRFLQYLPLEPKEYLGTIRFGYETNTHDAEGELTNPRPLPSDLAASVEQHLPTFRGPIDQIPPMFSAVKRAGKPLYEYARKGETLERESRRVFIEEFTLEAVENEIASVRVVCSGGTYVRTLAHDLGQAIGCGAHLASLRRTRVGRFTLAEAQPTEALNPELLIPLRDALPPMPLVPLNEGQVNLIQEGRWIVSDKVPPKRYAGLLDPEGRVIGVARAEGNRLQPECVLPGGTYHALV